MAASPDGAPGALRLRALYSSALFVCALAGALPAGAACAPDRIDERIGVDKVYDGDTVLLSDGRKVRLIGLNTPELAHGEHPAEAFAEAAQQELAALLATGDYRIGLRYDAEHFDRYGRTLAHVFTRGGENAAARLVGDGLAAAIAVPPNLWQQPCYQRLARAARERGNGIWSLPRYRGLTPAQLQRARGGGFFALTGTVRAVSDSRKAVWLELAEGVALRLPRDDLVYFEAPPDALTGRRVLVLGWVSQRRGRTLLHLRHPSQLEIID